MAASRPPLEELPWRRSGLAWFVLALALTPALLAVWLVPGFVTQDGPAHLYNAHILVESFREGDSLGRAYEVRWRPLPNWGGHLILAGMLTAGVPAWTADRLLTSATLVGLAAGILMLRRRVAGTRGLAMAAPLAALLALNVLWLLGFASFLLGAALFPVTLAVWWGGRHRFGPGRTAALGALLTLGYFVHLVSLGLTVVGVLTLSAATRTGGGPRAWWRRAGWTTVGLLPLVPLALLMPTGLYLFVLPYVGRSQQEPRTSSEAQA